jgi:hypothetical protein
MSQLTVITKLNQVKTQESKTGGKTCKILPLTGLELFECPANGRGDVIRWKQRAELLIGHVHHMWDYISAILEKGVDYEFGPDASDIAAEEFAALNPLATARAVERCRRWEREVNEYTKNKKKLYRLLWKQCEDALKKRLENDQEYSVISDEQDPIRL